MAYRFGADEAGKGPVIGSMFAAAVALAPDATLPVAVDDSKELEPAHREEIATALRATDGVSVATAEVTPARIDDPTTDMNGLTAGAQARAIADVAEPGTSGIVDACDTDEARFARRVADAVPADVEITAEHRADANHELVAAASVVAKVARDAHVADLAAEYGELGSGYPSDQRTRDFLAEYIEATGELPPCARESWQTARDLLAVYEQAGLADF